MFLVKKKRETQANVKQNKWKLGMRKYKKFKKINIFVKQFKIISTPRSPSNQHENLHIFLFFIFHHNGMIINTQAGHLSI